jgi:predicted 3-demethylubiquinone-9 3-methyltransferase (glyoxalase superfamily)
MLTITPFLWFDGQAEDAMNFYFFVGFETQNEIDDLWTKLIAGGGDPARRQRVMNAMFTMDKLDIAKLQAAYDNKQAA